MKKEKLKKILDDISKLRIAVIGDFCLDAYWFIDESKSEISIETNLITRPVEKQKYSLGGAANVINNLVSMGIKDLLAFGVIGPDLFGSEMVRIMMDIGLHTKNLLVQPEGWLTHVYAKPYMHDQELNRLDFGNYNILSQETADLLLSNLINEIHELDLIIINQQVSYGIHTEYFRSGLLKIIKKYSNKLFVTDSREFNDFYDGTVRKMNELEAARLCKLNINSHESVSHKDIINSAVTLYKRFLKPIFITRGNKGSLIIDHNGISEIPSLMITSKIDVVGAGDSYLAGAASALAAGYDMRTAATLGTYVSGVTVQKLFQTGTATPKEILKIGENPDFVYSIELSNDIMQAEYFLKTEIEIVNKSIEHLQIKHAIFDHDGTISTLREGWENVMAPMMIKAILGNKNCDIDEKLFQKVQLRVNKFIDETTGIQTLAQMKGLVELIRDFGLVPEEEILDEFGYKNIYNDELLQIVKKRELKLKHGELSFEDLTVKNSISFLQELYDSGIKLYLASGTDIDDVKKEAKILGYDHLFEGRIYGAVGDISKEAKKIVLESILESIGKESFGQIVTFGDGPVEIRETKKYLGLAVGIASDEIKRFGLNIKKRSRLIRAGADIIIPDFSQSLHLLRLLNITKKY